jgi:hypothetical protein
MGILGNIDDIFTDGDIEVDNLAANDPNSLLRTMFKNIEGPHLNELSNPFQINIEGGKKTLHVVSNVSRPNPVFDMDKGCKVSDVIDDVNEVACNGWLNIAGDKDIREYIAPVISADKISVQAAKDIKKVTFVARHTPSSVYLPTLMFYNGHVHLTDCDLDFDTPTNNKANIIKFKGIPTFNKVSSKGANYIQMSYPTESDLIWDNPKLSNIFEFGYTVTGANSRTGKPKSARIGNMRDILKLVSSKASCLETDWDEYPIRIKKGFKVTDLLDVSDFNDLYLITISGQKMSLVFENTKHPWHKSINICQSYLSDMPHAAATSVDPNNISMKYARNGVSVQTKYAKYESDLMAQIPVTDDGWMVCLYRVS